MHLTNNTRVLSAWGWGKRFFKYEKNIYHQVLVNWCDVLKMLISRLSKRFIHCFLRIFLKSKLLIKGFFSLQKKNWIRIQGLPIVLRRPLLPNFPRGSTKTQSTIKITYSCTAGGCGGNKIKFSWSMAAGARYILLANDILTVCMVNPNFFEGT